MNITQNIELLNVTIKRLNQSGLWKNVGFNYKKKDVYSCREAARFRDRLGSGEIGVPLWVELKSQISAIKNKASGEVIYLIAHTRANTRFDDKKLLKILNIDPKTIEINNILDDADEISSKITSQSSSEIFGLVNPLNIDKVLIKYKSENVVSSIVQVFDNSILLHGGYPNTITTNVGVRNQFIEIKPEDLIICVKEYFDNVIVADCAFPDPIWLGEDGKYVKNDWSRFPPPTGPKIGLLTGNSPESGLTLWNDFLDKYRELSNNLADVLMPEVIIYSLPQMGLSMELVNREEDVWHEMQKAIKLLLDAGCKIITIACNTTIYFGSLINKLCEPYKAKFVSIAEACLPEIKYQLKYIDEKSPAVGLVGIGPVIDVKGEYSGYAKQFRENGIKVFPSDATNLAWAIKRVGTSDNQDEIQSLIEKFRALIRELSEVKIVVLSLTEVSLIYRKHIQKLPKKYKPNKILIDPLYELSRYLVYLYLLYGMKENKVCQIPDEFNLESKLQKIVYSR